jgi:outer membrane protein, multidrug efflux system
MYRYRALYTLTVCAFITACASLAGPDYVLPDAPMKSGWSLNPGDASKGSEVIKLDWWTEFGDLYLNKLIEKAISDNISIQVAAARAAEARGGVEIAKAGSLPRIDASGKVEGGVGGKFGGETTTPPSAQGVLLTVPGRGTTPAIIRPLGTPNKPESTSPFVTDEIGIFLSWELDLWGKLEKGIEAQQAAYQASESDWRGTWLIIVSEVANKYFLIRQFDEQIAQQRKSLEAAQQILAAYRAEARGGLKPETDVLAQQAEINALQTQLLDLQLKRTLAENELATLVGTPAGDFRVPVASLQNTVKIPGVPTGLPPDLLLRRPDIIAAEYNVLAKHELVGKARLEKLPSISLTAKGAMSSLLSTAIKAWTFGIGPSINIPIFDPSIDANIKVSEAEKKTAEEEYRLTVINAFQEVENALVNRYHHKEQRREIEERKKRLAQVAAQVRAQVRVGIASQLRVFETERTLLQASQDLLTSHQQILSDTITLYKALGGGWPRVTVDPPERKRTKMAKKS